MAKHGLPFCPSSGSACVTRPGVADTQVYPANPHNGRKESLIYGASEEHAKYYNSNEARDDIKAGIGFGLALGSGGAGLAGSATVSTILGIMGAGPQLYGNFEDGWDFSNGYEDVKSGLGFFPVVGPYVSITDGFTDVILYTYDVQ